MQNRIKILIVHDDEASRYALAHSLKTSGYHVLETATAATGRELLRQHVFEIAILDVNLPDGRGTDLCREIKNDPKLNYTYVLQVSASLISLADRVSALDCGADAFLVMPIDRTELLAQVRALLRMREAERAREQTERDRKLAEEALRDSNHRLRLAMQTAGMFAFEWDVETDLVTRSEEAGSILGLKGEAALRDTGRAYFPRVHAEDRERFAGLLRRLTPGNSYYTVRYRMVRPDGSLVALEERGSAFFDGEKLRRLIGMVADTTERGRAEQRLNETQENLRQAHQRLMFHMENSPLAVIEFDPELRLTFWSRAAVKIFGWEAVEVLGQCLWDIPCVFEEDLAKVRGVTVAMLSGHEARMVSPNRNLRKDGAVIWCEWHNSALTDSSGRTSSILSLVRDVTEQKKFEAELDRAVTERTGELREINEQLNAFCYSVAHDLKAPLRAQAAFATILEQDFGEKLGEIGRSYTRRISEAAERQSRLVSDLLAHMGLSRTDLPVMPVDLEPVLQQARADLVLEIQHQDAVLEVGSMSYRVLGNPASLHLILQNLVSNAIKFVAPGVVPRVRVWAEPAVRETQGGTVPLVRCWVEDNGIGVPAKHQGKLFGVFQRLHAGQNYLGTGMGLAIVKKAIERMGGEVGVEPGSLEGSRFWFELPAAPEAPSPGGGGESAS